MSQPATNPFKQALREKRAQIGLWLSAASPYLSEVSATAEANSAWLMAAAASSEVGLPPSPSVA